MFNFDNTFSLCFKIQFIGILIFSCSRVNAQSSSTWDRDTIQDSLLSLKIDSFVDKNLWEVDPFETEMDSDVNKTANKLFKEFYMQDISYTSSEVIKDVDGRTVHSYSSVSIFIARKNRRLLLRTILFFSGVKFNSFKGTRNCIIITRESNEKGKTTNFKADSIKLAKSLLSHLK